MYVRIPRSYRYACLYVHGVQGMALYMILEFANPRYLSVSTYVRKDIVTSGRHQEVMERVLTKDRL